MDENIQKVLTFVSQAFPVQPVGFPIAIAGSFAMYCYMVLVLKKTVDWIPSDCDIFVPTDDDEAFDTLISCFRSFLRGRKGIWCSPRTFCCKYTHSGHLQRVTNFKLPGNTRLPVISFIQHPKKKAIRDIVSDFDIDICKVALYFSGDNPSFDLDPEVIQALATATASVTRYFLWKRYGPNPVELSYLVATYNRMTKYQDRGFTFINGPDVDCLEDAAQNLALPPYHTDEDESACSSG